MKEKEYFEQKLVESAEIQVDVKETYSPKIGRLAKIFKFAFGQKPSDFKTLVKYQSEGGDEKLSKLLETFITVSKYYDFIGQLDKINRILGNFGVSVSVAPWPPVGGPKSSPVKYRVHWNELYEGEEVIAPGSELLDFLVKEAVDANDSILSLKDESKAISDDVEVRCEVSKSSFSRGVSLKTSQLTGKDIGETVRKIEKKADELSEVIEVL